jgi:hypothetical protein
MASVFMEATVGTILSGKRRLTADNADLSGSRFNNVKICQAELFMM